MTEQESLELINTTPVLLSLLYNFGLMPEQIERGTHKWRLMLAMAWAYKAGRDSVPLKYVAF